jgi:DNA-binding PadR family transcriptional regulator
MSIADRDGETEDATMPATAWAVLGLLSFGQELSGYDLKKWADTSLRFFYWSPATSQIYGELRRLERLGYVEVRTAAQDELRNKRLYRITPRGSAALRSWTRDTPVVPPMLKHGVLLRVWLGHMSEVDELVSIVRQHREYAESMIAELHVSEDVARSSVEWTFPAIVARWGEGYYQAERDLADQLLRELEALEEQRPEAGDAD